LSTPPAHLGISLPAPIAASASLLFVALLFLVPFANPHHVFPLTSFYSEWLAFALGLTALLPLAAMDLWRRLEIPGLAAWLLAFAALILLQLPVVEINYPQLSVIGFLYVVWAALLVWLGSVLKANCGMEPVARSLAAALVLGGLLNAAAAILRFYRIESLLDPVIVTIAGAGAYGNLAQNNHFADYLTLALVSALYLHARARLTLAMTFLCAGIFLFVLALSGSRAGWLYLAALVPLSLLFLYRSSEPGNRSAYRIALLLLPALAVMEYAISASAMLSGGGATPLTPGERTLAEYFGGQSLATANSGIKTRIYLAHQAWLMFLGQPLFGIGFGQFPGYFFEQSSLLADYRIPNYDRHAHNALTQLLAETGIAGVVLVGAGFAYWCRGARRAGYSFETWWLSGLLAVLFIHSMVEYPLWYAQFLGVAAILLGIGSQPWLRPKLHFPARYAYVLLIGAGLYAAGGSLRSYREIEWWAFKRPISFSLLRTPEAEKALIASHRQSLFLPYAELAYAESMALDPQKLRDQLPLSQRALKFHPTLRIAYMQVLLLALSKRSEEAALLLRRAVIVFPQALGEFLAALRSLEQQDPKAYGEITRLAEGLAAQQAAQHGQPVK